MSYDDEGGKGGGKGGGKDRINAQYSSMPATECIGAGRVDGWFVTTAYKAESRGWGHIQSKCFEGDLFFHLQRSPWLRGINFQQKDEVEFEVVEIKGRCEAVKLMLPHQVKALEEGAEGKIFSAEDFVGQRIEGTMKSHHLLVAKQNWGFVASEMFHGEQVFWHIKENPDMEGVEFDRDDIVDFDVCLDDKGKVRAKNMTFLAGNPNPIVAPPELTPSKKRKKEQWLRNWSSTPPPDWVCQICGWKNFGRNKTCNFNNKNNQNCPGVRPPREEWPDTTNLRASDVAEDDGLAQKALNRQSQARDVVGKVEEVPIGWHSEGISQALEESSGSVEVTAQDDGWDTDAHRKKREPIKVPVLGEDPTLLEAGLPGAIAAQQLKERLEKGTSGAATGGPPPRPPPPPPPHHQQQQYPQQHQQYPPQYDQHGGAFYPQVVYPPQYHDQYQAQNIYAPQHQQYPPQHQQQFGYQPQQPPLQQIADQFQSQQQTSGGVPPKIEAAAAPAAGSSQAILALCLGAFDDLTLAGEPMEALMAKADALVAEVNNVLGDDRKSKHSFAMQLGKHAWIVMNGFEVRYKPGKNLIAISYFTDGAQA